MPSWELDSDSDISLQRQAREVVSVESQSLALLSVETRELPPPPLLDEPASPAPRFAERSDTCDTHDAGSLGRARSLAHAQDSMTPLVLPPPQSSSFSSQPPRAAVRRVSKAPSPAAAVAATNVAASAPAAAASSPRPAVSTIRVGRPTKQPPPACRSPSPPQGGLAGGGGGGGAASSTARLRAAAAAQSKVMSPPPAGAGFSEDPRVARDEALAVERAARILREVRVGHTGAAAGRSGGGREPAGVAALRRWTAAHVLGRYFNAWRRLELQRAESELVGAVRELQARLAVLGGERAAAVAAGGGVGGWGAGGAGSNIETHLLSVGGSVGGGGGGGGGMTPRSTVPLRLLPLPRALESPAVQGPVLDCKVFSPPNPEEEGGRPASTSATARGGSAAPPYPTRSLK